ncbi:hypothetical protein HYE82_32695 [Streptomyces sp. BR123]|uniref:hypothetical protein n=1 Tax=Streptomyces sp. BR123 TaxID=2749828 RepID=UPI0015C4D1EB|nr:hypothetical protein [Streptomyces sp. BR123]NXY99059.1 hypothetical protein [Streptomyces sp. BR123]
MDAHGAAHPGTGSPTTRPAGTVPHHATTPPHRHPVADGRDVFTDHGGIAHAVTGPFGCSAPP